MSKRILLIGDPHFEVSNLEMMTRACQEILDLIDEKQVQMCIILGDTLHYHEKLHMLPLTQATEWFKEIAMKCRLIVLIGNHDRVNNQDFLSGKHPFVGLKEANNITIVETTIWDEKENFIYVPYVAPGRFNEALSRVEYNPGQERAPRAIFAHQEIKGCILGNQESTKGDYWSSDWSILFSGHIHKYHLLPGVVYVGTFHQQNYGEDPDKGVMLIMEEDGKFKMERFPLKSVPIKTTIHLTLEQLPNFAEHIPPNCQVKAVVYVDATERKMLDSNPYYQALKEMVEKVVPKTTGDKANLAESMVNQMKNRGFLKAEQQLFSVEEIVQGMLADDPETLKIFNEEILA